MSAVLVSAPVVMTQASGGTSAIGALFDGLKFFVTQRTPSRRSYVAKIESNGGQIVRLEEQADFIIADHLRPRDCPAGSVSYNFIDVAIRDGRTPDHRDYAAGAPPGVVRDVGSSMPTKGTRTPFTAEDDVILWNWVEACKSRGHQVKGNEIYKQLEARNSRHTFQSWRDRYVKKLMDKPPAGRRREVGNESSPSAQPNERRARPAPNTGSPSEQADKSEPAFTEEDTEMLMSHAQEIEKIDDGRESEAWDAWAEEFPYHTARSWRAFYRTTVRPRYIQKQKQSERSGRVKGSGAERDAHNSIPQLEPKDKPVSDDPGLDGGERVEVADDLDGSRSATSEPSREGKRKRDDPLPHLGDALDSSKRRKAQRSNRNDLESNARGGHGDLESIAFHASQLAHPRGHDFIETAQAVGPVDSFKPPTSELNQAAHEQLQQEAETAHAPQIEPLPTSGAGALAHAQMVVDQFDTARADKVDLLTAANLASQQAEHNSQLLRGVDLPPDDEDQDQSEYVRYLQTATGQLVGSQLPKYTPAAVVDMDDSDEESEREVLTSSPPIRQRATLPMDEVLPSDNSQPEHIDLPHSNQAEIGELFEDNLNWPASPRTTRQQEHMTLDQSILKQSREAVESQNVGFETQIQHSSFFSEAMENTEFSSQKFGSQVEMSAQLPTAEDGQRPASPNPDDEKQRSNIAEEGLLHDGAGNAPAPPNDEEDDHDDNNNEGLVDLTIPEPEGGFASSSPIRIKVQHGVDATRPPLLQKLALQPSSDSSYSPSVEDGESQAALRPTDSAALDTQAVLNAETQIPDLGMPLPPDSDEESEHLPSPRQLVRQPVKEAVVEIRPQISQSQTDPDMITSQMPSQLWSPRDDIESQSLSPNEMDDWIETLIVKKYNEATIIWALKRCSMRPDLAELVLYDEKNGKGLPGDIPGIWSEEEDDILESGDARGLRKLEGKHGGWDELTERMEFLTNLREE